MRGLTLNSRTPTNQLHLTIPDELRGVELQIIILPLARDNDDTIEFFSDEELKAINGLTTSSGINDKEDYTKW